MQTTVTVIGDGSWGTAMALLLTRSHRVRLWSAQASNAAIMREHRENRRFLPGVPIPTSIELHEDERAAIDGADWWISAVPTVYLRSTLERFRSLATPDTRVVSLTKGLENQTFLRPSQILREVLGTQNVVALSGPSHAEEVSRGRPTSVVIGGPDAGLTFAAQTLISGDRFRVYTNSDEIGVELAGALKNVIGIAAGVCDGLCYGDNAKSALMTRGLVEMARFGVAMGAEAATFQGLAGMGDLITTCMSLHGRNRRVGERLGKGEKLAEILASTPMVSEGVSTARSVYERTRSMGLDMPIMTGVYQMLYENKPAHEAVAALMARTPGSECI